MEDFVARRPPQIDLGPHPSQPYNPDIANAFFRAGEIETWGRWIAQIFRSCRAAGTPEPRIEPRAGGLWVEFGFSDEYLQSVGMQSVGMTSVGMTSVGMQPKGKAARTEGEAGRPGSATRHDRSRGEGTATRAGQADRIVALLRGSPKLTLAALAERMNTSAYRVRHHLDRLRQAGRVRCVGSRRAGSWQVVD